MPKNIALLPAHRLGENIFSDDPTANIMASPSNDTLNYLDIRLFSSLPLADEDALDAGDARDAHSTLTIEARDAHSVAFDNGRVEFFETLPSLLPSLPFPVFFFLSSLWSA